MIVGKVWKFGNNIDTDVIIPYKYKARTIDPYELGKHAMEGIRPNFSGKVSKGDVIVAGRNFGCGSSREQAPIAIKYSGISCVIAESFARIFYRNAINVGLAVIICEGILKEVEEGDMVEVNLEEGIVKVLNRNKELKADKLPKFLMEILSSGGLVDYYKQNKRFPWS
jgi:3-isopropylmalate/(R)-2-methylmalate dehydratase small subunit